MIERIRIRWSSRLLWTGRGLLLLVALVRINAFLLTPSFRSVCRPENNNRRSTPYILTKRKTATVSFLSSASNQTSESFEALLLEKLENGDESSPITVEGYVLSKRSLGKGLVFADFHVSGYPDDCQTMLRADSFDHNFTAARKLLLKGTKVRLTGKAAPTRIPGNVVLLVQSLTFLGFPRQLQYIQILVEQYQDGSIAEKDFLGAISDQNIEDKLPQVLHFPPDDISSRERKAKMKSIARQILESLPIDEEYPYAADQLQLAKEGNFMVPQAPPEWAHVPKFMLERNKTGQTKTKESASCMDDVASGETVSVSGWIQNRRRFDGNITMVALVDDVSSLMPSTTTAGGTVDLPPQRLVAVIHPNLVSFETAGIYRNLAAVGAKVKLQGWIDRRGQLASVGTLWVSAIQLLQSSSRPTTICHLLELLEEKKLELDEVQQALLLSTKAEVELLINMDATQRRWKANQFGMKLQEATIEEFQSSINTNKQEGPQRKIEVLDKYNAVVEKYPIEETTLDDMRDLLEVSAQIPDMSQAQGTTLFGPGRATLPLGMPGSKWQRKKRPQLAWMGGQIRQVLESHPEYKTRRLEILDIGGGKGALAQYLGKEFHDKVQIRVVDICEGAVANGAKRAEKLNLPIDFSLADASQALNLTMVDVVVSLHGCGHLSDIALAHALQNKAGFVIVPCCFNSNPYLKIPVKKDHQPVPEWLNIPENDWAELKLLAEIQGDITLANRAIATICAIRADACPQTMASPSSSSSLVSIKRFPIEFSTRNTVLVGRCR